MGDTFLNRKNSRPPAWKRQLTIGGRAVFSQQVGLLWDVLEIGEETTDLEFVVKVYNVIPANPVYAHYSGSLTTPPCTEVSENREGYIFVVTSGLGCCGSVSVEVRFHLFERLFVNLVHV